MLLMKQLCFLQRVEVMIHAIQFNISKQLGELRFHVVEGYLFFSHWSAEILIKSNLVPFEWNILVLPCSQQYQLHLNVVMKADQYGTWSLSTAQSGTQAFWYSDHLQVLSFGLRHQVLHVSPEWCIFLGHDGKHTCSRWWQCDLPLQHWEHLGSLKRDWSWRFSQRDCELVCHTLSKLLRPLTSVAIVTELAAIAILLAFWLVKY